MDSQDLKLWDEYDLVMVAMTLVAMVTMVTTENFPEMHILHLRYVFYMATWNIMILFCRGMSPLTPHRVGILIAICDFMVYNNKCEKMPIFHKNWEFKMKLQKT